MNKRAERAFQFLKIILEEGRPAGAPPIEMPHVPEDATDEEWQRILLEAFPEAGKVFRSMLRGAARDPDSGMSDELRESIEQLPEDGDER